MDIQKYLEKYYTQDGIKALENRLKGLIALYMENKEYPFVAKMFGFLPLKIHSRKHHEGMLDELSQLLGRTEIKMEVKNND